MDNSSHSIESSYTWTDLIQSRHQFSVVAFTSKGPREPATLMLPTLFTNGKETVDIYTVEPVNVHGHLKISMLA